MGQYARAVLFETHNGELLAGIDDVFVARKLGRDGEYGKDELERLLAYADPNEEVLIVGAHVGSIAIPVSRRCRHLVAVEANPDNFHLLELNARLNRCQNIDLINIAASDKEGSIQFVVSRANSGGSKRMPLVRKYAYFADAPTTIEVGGAPLDRILHDRSPSLIFMDIEGSEYFAVKGMQRLLAGTKTFFMEFVPHHLKYVSGATVADLIALIEPHFNSLHIPTKQITVAQGEFTPVLQRMYDKEEVDDGIIFKK
jgi:FkbM family methyltransferase